jgi:hypothetical protein
MHNDIRGAQMLYPMRKRGASGRKGFRVYLVLRGMKAVHATDNRAVQSFLTNTRSRTQVSFERMVLSRFDYIIGHCPNKTNVADYIIRDMQAKRVRWRIGKIRGNKESPKKRKKINSL